MTNNFKRGDVILLEDPHPQLSMHNGLHVVLKNVGGLVYFTRLDERGEVYEKNSYHVHNNSMPYLTKTKLTYTFTK